MAILGWGASGKERTGQGTERQSPASGELTFRGQRNTPEDVSSQKVAFPNAQQSEGGRGRGWSLGHPCTGLRRGGRGGEALPTEQGLRTRSEESEHWYSGACPAAALGARPPGFKSRRLHLANCEILSKSFPL